MALGNLYAGGNQAPLQSMLGNFMQAKQQTQTRNLMAPAMSGDQQALAQLMAVNPDAGMQVHNTLQQQNQFAMQRQLQEGQLGLQKEQMALEERKLNMPLPPIKLGEGETLVDPLVKRYVATLKDCAGANCESFDASIATVIAVLHCFNLLTRAAYRALSATRP